MRSFFCSSLPCSSSPSSGSSWFRREPSPGPDRSPGRGSRCWAPGRSRRGQHQGRATEGEVSRDDDLMDVRSDRHERRRRRWWRRDQLGEGNANRPTGHPRRRPSAAAVSPDQLRDRQHRALQGTSLQGSSAPRLSGSLLSMRTGGRRSGVCRSAGTDPSSPIDPCRSILRRGRGRRALRRAGDPQARRCRKVPGASGSSTTRANERVPAGALPSSGAIAFAPSHVNRRGSSTRRDAELKERTSELRVPRLQARRTQRAPSR